MLGKTHMAVGVATTLALTKPQTVSELVLAAGLGSLGALISDIDVGTSKSHKDADKVTMLAVGVMVLFFVMDYFAGVGIIQRILQSSSKIARAIAGCFIFTGVCAFGKEQPHRSFMHSFLALFLLGFALALIRTELVKYFAIGFLSHLATDLFNRKKVRLFYPVPGGFCLNLFHAHGLANTIFFTAGCVIAGFQMILVVFRFI